MIKLPCRIVQPLKAWAEVTESIVLFPKQSLGHRPAHGEQINLHREGHDRLNLWLDGTLYRQLAAAWQYEPIIQVPICSQPWWSIYRPTVGVGKTFEQKCHFKANNQRVYWRGGEKNILVMICRCRFRRLNKAGLGLWHEKGMRADIMARRGPEAGMKRSFWQQCSTPPEIKTNKLQ